MHGATVIKMNDYSDIEIKEILGRGAFGDVFKAIYNGAEVAVKEIKNRGKTNNKQYKNIENFLARVKREFETIYQLNHPNIVKAINIQFKKNDVKEVAYLIMEYCSGDSLYELINDKEKFKKVDLNAKKRIMRRILDALLYLSERKIVHRDLKPSNILFARNDDLDSLKLIDFGFSRYWANEEEELTKCGTDDYLCPEFKNEAKIREKYQFKSPAPDVWACGIIFYELLYGKHPFENIVTKPKFHPMDSNLEVVSSRIREIISSKIKKNKSKQTIAQIFHYLNKPYTNFQACLMRIHLKEGVLCRFQRSLIY